MNGEKRKLLENQDWPYIIKDLTLYAVSRFRFWNLLTDKGVKGYSPEDIASKAIEMVLTEEWYWDPDKSDLLGYLKFHVVKGLMANLAKNKEVKKGINTELSEIQIKTNYSIDDNLNAKQVVKLIEVELKDEKILLNIFYKLMEGMKRAEICEFLKIELKDYNNLIRKLKNRLLKMENKQLFDSLK